MSVRIGIDIGGSITKIVGFKNDTLIGTLQVRASQQVTAIFGAFGNFLHCHNILLCDVQSIVLTGVGASFYDGNIYGIETLKTDEFKAIGYGGLYLAGKDEALVASLGTGTAFVRSSLKDGAMHIGGSGVGGGTLMGLAAKILGKNDMAAILALAEHGKLENIDLTVHEILNYDIPSLPPNLTASNFGKIKSTATDSDFALGIINMVFQTVGMMAVFAARNDHIKDVVLTGSLAVLPQAKDSFAWFNELFGINFIIPENAVFATAIGAVRNIVASL